MALMVMTTMACKPTSEETTATPPPSATKAEPAAPPAATPKDPPTQADERPIPPGSGDYSAVLADARAYKRGEIDFCQCGMGDGVIGGRLPIPSSQMRMAADQCGFQHGRRKGVAVMLGEVAAPLGQGALHFTVKSRLW